MEYTGNIDYTAADADVKPLTVKKSIKIYINMYHNNDYTFEILTTHLLFTSGENKCKENKRCNKFT